MLAVLRRIWLDCCEGAVPVRYACDPMFRMRFVIVLQAAAQSVLALDIANYRDEY